MENLIFSLSVSILITFDKEENSLHTFAYSDDGIEQTDENLMSGKPTLSESTLIKDSLNSVILSPSSLRNQLLCD